MIDLKKLLHENDLYKTAVSSSNVEEKAFIDSQVNLVLSKFQQTFDSLVTFLNDDLLFSGSSSNQESK